MKKLLLPVAVIVLALIAWVVLRKESPAPSGENNGTASQPAAATTAAGVAGDGQQAVDGAASAVVEGTMVATDVASSATIGGNGAPSTAAGASAPVAAPVETQLLYDKGLKGQEAQSVLSSQGFDRFVDRLSRESDSDALAMSQLYEKRLADSLSSQKQFAVKRVACGAHLCAATVSGDGADENEFVALVLAQETGPKLYSVMTYVEPQGPGRPKPEFRILFTTDPKMATIQVQ